MLGLSCFSGEDQCDFQLALLNDVPCVPQSSCRVLLLESFKNIHAR